MLEQYVSSYIMLLLGAFYVFGHISTSINSCYHFSACLVSAAAAWKKNEEKKIFSHILDYTYFHILDYNLLVTKWQQYLQTFTTDSDNSALGLETN